jgi:hypothetical protein
LEDAEGKPVIGGGVQFVQVVPTASLILVTAAEGDMIGTVSGLHPLAIHTIVHQVGRVRNKGGPAVLINGKAVILIAVCENRLILFSSPLVLLKLRYQKSFPFFLHNKNCVRLRIRRYFNSFYSIGDVYPVDRLFYEAL